MAKCRMCGKCCEAISLDHECTKSNLRINYPDTDDVSWVLHWLAKISRRKAIGINPNLANSPAWSNFYTCKMLDINNRCAAHGANKPYPCSGYPGYGEVDDIGADKTAHPECAFRKEKV